MTAQLPPEDLLPFDPHTFVPRQEPLAELKALLIDGDAKTVVLLGGPGVGKTTLAMAFAHSSKAEFPGGVFGVSAEDISNTDFVIRNLANKVNGAEIAEPASCPAWDIWNKYISDKNILVIIDNADDLDFKGGFRPIGKTCKTILTTRDRLIPHYLMLPARCTVSVMTFDLSESIDLLQRILSRKLEVNEQGCAKEICTVLGNLPLGIYLAGSYINVYGTPLAKYAQNLRDEKKRLEILDLGSAIKRMDIEYVLGLSLKTNPDLVPLFASLGVCRSNGFTVEHASAIANGIVGDVEHALNTLYKISLVEKLNPERYYFHPLIRDYARKLARENNLLTQAEAKYYGWFEELIKKYPVHEEDLAKKYKTKPECDQVRSENFKRLGMELDGLIAAAEWALSYTDVNLGTWYEYWRNLRDVFDQRGYTDRAIELLETALEICDKNIDLSSRRGISEAQAAKEQMKAYYLGQLGKYYDRAGRSQEAEVKFRAALDIEKDKERRKHLEHRISLVQRNLGDYEQAVKQLTQNLKQSESGSIESLLYSLNSLARALIDSGKPKEALVHLERANQLEEERPSEISSKSITLSETGRAYKRLGEYPQALESYKKSIAILTEAGNPRTYSILCNEIGDTLGFMGEYQEAIEYFKKAFEIAKSGNETRSINITQKRFLNAINKLIAKEKEYKNNKVWGEALRLATIWVEAEKLKGNNIGEFWALIDCGNFASHNNDIEFALEQFDQALTIAKKRHFLDKQSIAHQCKARSLRDKGDGQSRQGALSELRMAEAIEVLHFQDKDKISEILLDKAKILLQEKNTAMTALAARCSESALAYTPGNPKVSALLTRSGGSTRNLNRLVVGQKGKITFLNKANPDEARHYGKILLHDSTNIFFHSSAYEETWGTVQEKMDVIVDYLKDEHAEKDPRATRVILAQYDK